VGEESCERSCEASKGLSYSALLQPYIVKAIQNHALKSATVMEILYMFPYQHLNNGIIIHSIALHSLTHTHTSTCTHSHMHTYILTQGKEKLPLPRLHVDFPLLLVDSTVVIVADHGYRTTTQQS